MSPTGDRLRVVADLRVSVDGTPVTVSAAGGPVQVRVDDPAAVVLAGPSLRQVGAGAAGARELLRSLQVAGVRVDVVGPVGPLVSLGDVPAGRLGRVTGGGVLVRPAAVVPLLRVAGRVVRQRAARTVRALRSRVRRRKGVRH